MAEGPSAGLRNFLQEDSGPRAASQGRLEHMVEFREAPVDNERVSPHKHRIADYLRPKTLAMLLLGFSSGLPFLLVGNTFGYWLRDEHTSLTAIGFLSWVGIAYSLKFLWAPVDGSRRFAVV